MGRFGSDCITLFVYKLWCLCSAFEVSPLDGGWGQKDARVLREMMMWTLSVRGEPLEEEMMCSSLGAQVVEA